jgi:hypothetical protein
VNVNVNVDVDVDVDANVSVNVNERCNLKHPIYTKLPTYIGLGYDLAR